MVTDDKRTALSGLRVLDLTRVLAGPTCTQLLGDLGATVVKLENPDGGDDTRQWGPPYVKDADGQDTDLSAYFMATNRNKHAITVDIRSEAGQAQLQNLARDADVVIENFKPGTAAKYGLGYEQLSTDNPGLIYCAISGFGQTGPNRDKPGYDLMAQGYGGIMSLTGAAGGEPMKVGVAVADVMCGMYATVGILAALNHRHATGAGQYIDLALVDTQIAWLINQGTNYLLGGQVPARRGNGHPNIVPYQVFPTRDGHVIIAVGNDGQFRRMCEVLGIADLGAHPDYATNPARVANRDALLAILTPLILTRNTAEVVTAMEAQKVPVGAVHNVAEALASDQAIARKMVVEMASDDGPLRLLGNPLNLSRTPVRYDRAPPHLGVDNATFEDGWPDSD
ncbi:MAG: CoA transferase [Pseudomonadota bacterium]